MLSRYYDAEVGRFISPDSVEYIEPETLGGLNLYSYCYNNPVMYYDPSGNMALAAVFMIIFAALLTSVGGVIGGIVANNNGADGLGIAAGVFLGMAIGFAAAGLIYTVGGAALTLAKGASSLIHGLTGMQIFAIGSLMYSFTALIVAPLYDITMIALDFDPHPYTPDKPGETPRHPYSKRKTQRKLHTFKSVNKGDIYGGFRI